MSREKQLELDFFQSPDAQKQLIQVITEISDELTGIRHILGAFLDIVKEDNRNH